MEDTRQNNKRKDLFPQVLPDMQDWPLVRLRKRKKEFIDTVVKATMTRILALCTDADKLEEEIAEAMYLEKNRIKLRPWAVDPKDEKDFWQKIEDALVDLPSKGLSKETQYYKLSLLLEEIVSRYAWEIVGDFRPGVYLFARRLLPHGFATLLNRKQITLPKSIVPRLHLEEKIQFTGYLDELRDLSTKGTIIMVPTHSSNLDSILMGWGIQELGLPAFHYGAGLNLFNVRILGWFMERLGAYKVDRRKKNRIYLETLKAYSTLSIKDGVHALFFPGGTRSRSGSLEDKLKLGLLGTAIDAQRIHIEENPENPKKIFVVPVVINYHFVLEAPTLIRDYLKSSGKEKYYDDRDELSTSYRITKFLLRFFTRSSQIALSFGKPMDVFGHEVDAAGNSISKEGQPIHISGYFMRHGEVVKDEQRESQYTRILAAEIARSYRLNALVFSSHLLAFTAFEMWQRIHRKLDLFEFLRLPETELVLPFNTFRKKIFELQQLLLEREERGELLLPPHMKLPVDDVIRHGLYHLGQFHARRTLKLDKAGNIMTEDLHLLLFYHNRLEGYGLETHI